MRYKDMTREERARLLERDFLDRDGETYVRIRKEGRIGWEDSLPKGAAYSSAIMSPKSDKELLTNATRLARQMITAMDTPYRVNVYIDSNKSLTDSRSVFVATEVFDDGDLTLGQKLDTFLGLAIHEGSHLLYTDFEELDKKADKLTRLIQNILEDEMIERKLGERKPGLANFLTAAKYYHFGRYERRKEEENVPSDPIARLFNAILATVRYPSALTEEMRDEFGAELLEIRDILTPYPERTADTMEKAKEILEVMRRFMAEHGNPDQWGPTCWPPESLVRSDIAAGNSYVCLNGVGNITGTFFYTCGADIEPTYREIEDGDWLDDSPYGVVHRIAADGTEKGTGAFCLEWAFAQSGHLRIDTHGDNTVMQNLLRKLGFVHCGTIHVEEDDAPRLAFEKTGRRTGNR